MSVIFGSLCRSERILPLESTATLEATGPYRVLFVDRSCHAKLYEHVSYYWTENRRLMDERKRWRRTVRSTRTPVQSTAFPALSRRQMHSQNPCAAGRASSPPVDASSGLPTSEATPSKRSLSLSHNAHTSALPLVAIQYPRYVGPFERLLCSSLLYSPLLPPIVEGGLDFSRGRWQVIQEVAWLAAEHSVPLSEALLYVSLSITYLDVSMTMMTGVGPVPVTDHNEAASAGEEATPSPSSEGQANTAQPRSFQELVERVQQHLHFLSSQAHAEMSAIPNAVGKVIPAQSASLALLRLAAREWESRRAATVTASAPLGNYAVPLRVRDLRTIWDCLPAGEVLFEPYHPHITPREEHLFHLPPLPYDPLLVFFQPVWQHVLLQCLGSSETIVKVREVAMMAAERRYCDLQKAEERRQAQTWAKDLPPFLSASPSNTSYMVFITKGKWRWNVPAGWRGYEGFVLQCGAWLQSDASIQPFVDPGLSLTIAELPRSIAELADFICRLGAQLPRVVNSLHVVVLTRGQTAYVTSILQSKLLDVYLNCSHGGVQELHVRSFLRGVALTLVQESGREVKVGNPSQLCTGAYPSLSAVKDRVEPGDGTPFSSSPFSLVASGGYEGVAAFLRYITTRPDNTFRNMAHLDQHHALPSTGFIAFYDAVTSLQEATVPMTKVIVLSRAEEGVLLRIFQSHPDACYLAGCGIRQLVLRASDGQPLLQRSCGFVTEWHLRDCYVGSQLQTLRLPRRVVPGKIGSLPVPSGLTDPTCITLGYVHRMLRHYFSSLTGTTTGSMPLDSLEKDVDQEVHEVNGMTQPLNVLDSQRSSTAGFCYGHTAGFPSSYTMRTTLYPVDRAVALFVLRHHPQYYTRLRGCGVQEVYVAEERSQPPSVNEHSKWMSESHIGPTGSSTQVLNGSAGTAKGVDSDELKLLRPRFLLERVCGRRIPYTVDDCFLPHPPYTLRPPQVLQDIAECGQDAGLPGRKRER